MQVLSIILAILAFGVLVIVHEFGHFITAKRGGVQVNEFWIGMGPTILKHEYHGTMYCLKLLPFGGACVMEGEDGESESEHAFGRARLRRRNAADVNLFCQFHIYPSFEANTGRRMVSCTPCVDFTASFCLSAGAGCRVP